MGLNEYLNAIEERFVALRGSGVMLSAKDVGIVEQWHASEIPLWLVMEVLEEPGNWMGASPPRSLTFFRRKVADRAESALPGHVVAAAPKPASAAASEPEPETDLRRLLLDALVAMGREHRDHRVRDTLRGVYQQLRAAPADADVWSLTAEMDAGIVESLHALCTPSERSTIDLIVGRSIVRGTMSEQVFRSQQDAVFRRSLRDFFGIVELMEVLLDEHRL